MSMYKYDIQFQTNPVFTNQMTWIVLIHGNGRLYYEDFRYRDLLHRSLKWMDSKIRGTSYGASLPNPVLLDPTANRKYKETVVGSRVVIETAGLRAWTSIANRDAYRAGFIARLPLAIHAYRDNIRYLIKQTSAQQ